VHTAPRRVLGGVETPEDRMLKKRGQGEGRGLPWTRESFRYGEPAETAVDFVAPGETRCRQMKEGFAFVAREIVSGGFCLFLLRQEPAYARRTNKDDIEWWLKSRGGEGDRVSCWKLGGGKGCDEVGGGVAAKVNDNAGKKACGGCCWICEGVSRPNDTKARGEQEDRRDRTTLH